MVSIVIVSHSQTLARAVVELAQQMVQNPVTVAIAAGIDDPAHPFGTDVSKIQAALESVYSDDGVVVLMDLGSALLSTEMALEFLPQEQQENIKLCEAPLVEGALAAIIQASTGASLEQVLNEARTALNAKIAHLSPTNGNSLLETQNKLEYPQTLKLMVKNPLGIHARPAAQFVTTAVQFESQISLQNLTTQSQPVNAKSINQLMIVGVRQNHQIEIAAVGEDATLALSALRELVENCFGEDPEVAPSQLRKCENRGRNATFIGTPASPGVVIAPLIAYHPSLTEVAPETATNPQTEWQNLQTAIQTAQQQINQLLQTTVHSDIFKAHLLYLQDPTILHQVHHQIFTLNESAAWSWKIVIEETMAEYQTLEDPYLQARAMDILDVGGRVLRLLTGKLPPSLELTQPGILVAQDLTPSEVAQFNTEQVLGVCTVAGSPTAHSALIANMLGIPMIVNVGAQLLELAPDTLIGMDGATGEIWLNPSEQLSVSNEPLPVIKEAITKDGHNISVVANILGIADAQIAINKGAQGVGVLRTELLYLERLTAPTEEEQMEIYQAIASIIHPHPLTIRTLDIGGDKPVPYLSLEREANPFLGWRGIRQSLDCQQMFKTQLRAILRAGKDYNIRLMFPMVASVKEVKLAKAILAQAKQELKEEGLNFDEDLKIGVMIEVPAAVTMADLLAQEADFLSVGTNDLSQYIMAADRTNPKVSKLADAFDPAVLRMIKQTITAGHNYGLKVSVCGQIASETIAIPLLLGLGTDELSVNPPSIPKIKQVICECSIEEFKPLVNTVLNLDSAERVREYLKNL